MYHRFGEQSHPSTNITLDQFQKHLEEFNKKEYNVLSLDFIIDSIITGTSLPENTIAISIDDGHKSILSKAWPLIKKYGYPVTCLLYTSDAADE